MLHGSVGGNRNLFVFVLCYGIFCYRCVFAFVVLDLDFQYQAKRLAAKKFYKLTYFVSHGTRNLTFIKKCFNFN